MSYGSVLICIARVIAGTRVRAVVTAIDARLHGASRRRVTMRASLHKERAAVHADYHALSRDVCAMIAMPWRRVSFYSATLSRCCADYALLIFLRSFPARSLRYALPLLDYLRATPLLADLIFSLERQRRHGSIRGYRAMMSAMLALIRYSSLALPPYARRYYVIKRAPRYFDVDAL